MMHGTKIDQYVLVDEQLNRRIFEDLEIAVAEAFAAAEVNKTIFITLPDGRRFSILECPKAMR